MRVFAEDTREEEKQLSGAAEGKPEMLKLKRLQQQQAAAKGAPNEGEAPAESTTPTATPAEGGEKKEGTQGYVLKKQNSKELLATRKSKSKENVFSLRTNRGGKRGKKTNAAELRATKGTLYY